MRQSLFLVIITATILYGADKKQSSKKGAEAKKAPEAAASSDKASPDKALPAKSGAQAPSAESTPSKAASTAKTEIVGGAPVDPNTYVIGAEDALLIRVWREPDISGPVMVRPDGKISLQLVNEIQAAGLTPKQLSDQIAEGLKKYITQPEVVVVVQTVNSKKYYVSGEIAGGGAKNLVVPTTVLEALVSTGGFKDFAKPTKIRIMRGSRILKFNYKEVIKGKHLEQNILLEPGDHIIVP